MLELVIRQSLELAEVALGDDVEIRFFLLVAGQARLGDGPRDRQAVLDRGERMTDAWCVRPPASEGTELLVTVGVTKSQAIPSRLDDEPGRIRARLDSFDEPVAAGLPEDVARSERRIGRVRVHALAPGTGEGDNLVPESHHGSLRGVDRATAAWNAPPRARLVTVRKGEVP